MTASKPSWRTAAVAIGTGLALTFATPAFAGADDDFARLLQLNPDVTAQELKDRAMEYAHDTGITYEEALAQARAEAEANLPESNSGGCDTSKKEVGYGEEQGDVFFASSTHGYDHGHVGLYSETDQITEAPGKDKKSGSFNAAGRTYCPGIEKMHVGTSSTNRGKAADYADSSLTGKPYDGMFEFNKNDDTSKLNCSELVWKAYKFTANVDLDSNGLTAVYPLDIKNSKLTDTYKTIS